MKNYVVKYRVNDTNYKNTLALHGGTESEAIAKLKSRGSVSKDALVIIISIEEI
jgi:hypothetical protein